MEVRGDFSYIISSLFQWCSDDHDQRECNIYLFLAEFSVRTVNYGPRFFHRFMARAINRWKKTRIRNLQFGPKNEANKLFIKWRLPVSGPETNDLTVIWQASKKKVFIGARKKWIAHNKGFPRK